MILREGVVIIMKTRLILIRHGETHKNAAKILHEAKDDAPLNEVGKSQAETAAKTLVRMGIDCLYSSSEIRAKETAQIIGKYCHRPVVETDDFRERGWGIFAGKSWDEVNSVLSKLSIEERYRYKPLRGESWQEVEARLIGSVKRILEENKGKKIVVVTHGGTIRTLMPYLLDVPREESFKYDPKLLSFTIFDFDGQRFNKVVIDEVVHLS